MTRMRVVARWGAVVVLVAWWVLVVVLGLVLGGCGWPGGGGDRVDYEGTQWAEAWSLDLTATLGAEVFEAQLTQIAEGER